MLHTSNFYNHQKKVHIPEALGTKHFPFAFYFKGTDYLVICLASS